MGIGIIGYGSFGSLLARHLAPHAEVIICDKKPIHDLTLHIQQGTIEQIAGADLVIIATELKTMPAILERLAGHVSPETIVMDVCSVKVRPAELLERYLGTRCKLLATHPMLGPSSVADHGDSMHGFTLVWHELRGGPFLQLEQLFGEVLGLTIRHMTPDDHDQQMAWVHALTFFVGRGLLTMDIPQLALDTGYYRKLRALVDLERTHSQALFETIETGNPYAAAVRRHFIHTLQQLDASIGKEPQ